MTQQVPKNSKLCDFPPCANLRSKEPGVGLCSNHAELAKFINYMYSHTLINQTQLIRILLAAQNMIANFPAHVAQAQAINAQAKIVDATKAKLVDTGGNALIKG